MLAYTGQRYGEVKALVWGDLHLDDSRLFVLIREETTKDKAKRPVPLHPERAGIEHKDATDRVVHFHAFRKTFQTFGVQAGVNQRAAQELLGTPTPI